jgi:hypothetical protein
MASLLLVAPACDQLLDISPRSALSTDGADGAAGADGDAGPRPAEVGDDHSAPPTCGAPTIDLQVTTSAAGRGAVTWQPAAWAVYSVPPGDDPMGTIATVWGIKHVFDDQRRIFKSASPHEPPYDQELALGLRDAGLTNTSCVDRRSTSVATLVFSAVLVPTDAAPIGVSFEGRQDHVIDGPLQVDAELSGDVTGSSYPLPAQPIPPAQVLYDYPLAFAGATVSGFKHVLLTWQQGIDPTLPSGPYTLRVSVSNVYGVSTSQSVHFVVP